MTRQWIPLCVLALTALAGSRAQGKEPPPMASKKKPHVVFVTGDHEYGSEVSMPMIARILEKHHHVRCTVLYATDPQGNRDPDYEENIPGLEALAEADAAVFFLRFRRLPAEQFEHIRRYLDSGRGIVGLRTATHSFRYKGGPMRKWNDRFGREVFGQKWISHHGHRTSTRVLGVLADHPILRGVAEDFWTNSWLYRVMPLHGDCRPLLIGQALKNDTPEGEPFGTPQPVAWTKSYTGSAGRTARVFFTTLGHPKGFEHVPVRRLLIQGIYWALGLEDRIPPAGCKTEIVGGYDPPNPK